MNKEGVFSGWIDTPLSEKGHNESREAGRQLKNLGYDFDIVHTSLLKRAIDTTDNLLTEMGLKGKVYITKNWRLNERHYGAIQGRNKNECIDVYGKQTVKKWRTSFVDPPPLLNFFDKNHPRFDALYADLPY